MCKVTVCILVDGEGNFVVGVDHDDALERYGDVMGDMADLANTGGCRVVQLTVNVPIPERVELPEVSVAPLGEPTVA